MGLRIVSPLRVLLCIIFSDRFSLDFMVAAHLAFYSTLCYSELNSDQMVEAGQVKPQSVM